MLLEIQSFQSLMLLLFPENTKTFTPRHGKLRPLQKSGGTNIHSVVFPGWISRSSWKFETLPGEFHWNSPWIFQSFATCKDDNDDTKQKCAARNATGTIHKAMVRVVTWDDLGRTEPETETGICHEKIHHQYIYISISGAETGIYHEKMHHQYHQYTLVKS